MNLGLIARADQTGLGIQTWEFARAMHPDKTLVLDFCHSSPKGLTLYPERFPGAKIIRGFPDEHQIVEFLTGLDVVFTAESPYTYALFSLANERGVRTVMQYNWEFLDYVVRPTLPLPTVFAAPSPWHFDDLRFANKVALPVPIATDRFPEREATSTARRFLHVVGHPAAHDRNGTLDLLAALRYVTADVEVTITCQDEAFLRGLRISPLPRNVQVIKIRGTRANYWDLYTGYDALVLPRRFGGNCLPLNEALGAGLPVIMPDTSPNNSWLPPEWLVPATKTGQFTARTPIDLHTVDHRSLAAKIDTWATDKQSYHDAQKNAGELAGAHSWQTLKSRYEAVLAEAYKDSPDWPSFDIVW